MHKTLAEVITIGKKYYKEPLQRGLVQANFRVEISTLSGLEDE